MRVFKRTLESGSSLGISEITFGEKDFPEIIVTDGADNEYHVSSDGVGIEIRCASGVIKISPISSNLIKVTNVPFTGE